MGAMMTCRKARSVFVTLGLTLPLWLGPARAQETPLVPGPSKVERLVAVDLAEVGLAGQSTAGRVTVGPGIITDDHTHTGRTSIVVVVEGTLTDVRGAVKKQYRPGDVIAVAEGVTHHVENYGAIPIVYIEVNTTAKKP